MIKVLTRRTRDLSYLSEDRALEIEGVRRGPALWWPRGEGRPAAPEEVLTSTPRSAVVGYDLVVAAPRAVSALMAYDERSAPAVIDAHRRAVGDALSYLEAHAVVVRDRAHGRDEVRSASWTAAASFTHGVNRHGEPHLHDHVIVGALPHEARAVLDGSSLRAHAVAADALYRASLRADIGRTTPWRVWRSRRGHEHVAGLDEAVAAVWPGRHDERGAKLSWTREEARRHWREDLSRRGSWGVVRGPKDDGRLDEYGFAASLEGREAVARRHLVEAWANAAPWGVRATRTDEAIELLYPEAQGVGLREVAIGVGAARMMARTRESARPLDLRELTLWAQRSQSRSRELSRARW